MKFGCGPQEMHSKVQYNALFDVKTPQIRENATKSAT
jgi:hypothetical protein